MNLFEQAVRRKIHFTTNRGTISLEEMLDMPLTGQSGFNLDELAKSVKRRLDTNAEESFVAPAGTTQAQKDDELRLELIKTVIAEKLEAIAKREKSAEIAARRQLLLQQLDQRNQAELAGKSKEDIVAELSALDAEAASA